MKWVMGFLIVLLLVVGAACAQDIVGQATDVVDGTECSRNSQCVNGDCIDGYCVASGASSGACTQNSECVDQCIDGVCGQVNAAPLCAVSCKISRATVTTNGGTTHDVVVGGGSYVSAGALEWRLANYESCGTSRALFHVIKRNYGDVISESYITLGEGETSGLLSHPTVSDVQLALTVTALTSVCQ